MSEPVIIFTKPGCPYCAAAKEELSRTETPYEERDVTSSPEVKDEALRLSSGVAAVPIIVREGEVTVGFGGS
ncbi:MAG: glutaredoxin [Thermoleophilia bacterium]|nr:glutaredoxin [Thermoleophilia bacterium]